jgi:hypothetical protein
MFYIKLSTDIHQRCSSPEMPTLIITILIIITLHLCPWNSAVGANQPDSNTDCIHRATSDRRCKQREPHESGRMMSSKSSLLGMTANPDNTTLHNAHPSKAEQSNTAPSTQSTQRDNSWYVLDFHVVILEHSIFHRYSK